MKCDKCGHVFAEGELEFHHIYTKMNLCSPCLHIVRVETYAHGAYPIYRPSSGGVIDVFFGLDEQ